MVEASGKDVLGRFTMRKMDSLRDNEMTGLQDGLKKVVEKKEGRREGKRREGGKRERG